MPSQDRNARNLSTGAGAALAKGYDLSHPDQVPQRVLDGMLWKAVHGTSAKPPPPGPNAVYERPGSDPDG